ncbi:MAG: tripartite motif-containing protein 71 [Nocardioidaceae bacterium]|nr:tripartite motif-containing protein 71 [Nocardioidaceae bacterium]
MRRRLTLLLTCCLLALGLTQPSLASATATDKLVTTHSASSATATYTSTIGYSGPAGIYPYGMVYDPTDSTVLVGDYWNYRTQRFTSSGQHLANYSNAVPRAAAPTGAGYGLAVDTTDMPTSGTNAGKANYWVAEQEQDRIVEYTHSGQFLQAIGVGGTGTDASHPGHAYPSGCGGGGAMVSPTHLVIDSNTSHSTYGDIFVSDVFCKNSVNVYDHHGHFLYRFDWGGYASARGVHQATPRGIGIGADGNVYVAEMVGKAVAVFTRAGQYVRSWSLQNNGPYGTGLADVRGIAMDNRHGVMYVVAAFFNCVFEFKQSDGSLIHKWCSTGGESASGADQGVPLDSIRFIAADKSGNVYVSDTWGAAGSINNSNGDSGYRVYKFYPGLTSGERVAPVSWATGSQPPPNGGYNNNNGVAVDNTLNSVFVVDQFEQRVQKFNGTKSCVSASSCPAFQLSFGSRVNPVGDSPGFSYPKSITAQGGDIYIGDQDGNAVVIYKNDGTFVHRFGDHGTAPGQFSGGVQGLAVTSDKIVTVDTGNCRVSVFSKTTALSQLKPTPTAYMGSCGSGPNQMSGPRGLALNADATKAYVVNTNLNNISIWNLATKSAATVSPTCDGLKLKLAVGDAFDPAHKWLYVADFGNARVVRMAPDGSNCTTVTTGLDTPQGKFKAPQYLAFDAAGNLYVSDKSRHVYKFAINN